MDHDRGKMRRGLCVLTNYSRRLFWLNDRVSRRHSDNWMRKTQPKVKTKVNTSTVCLKNRRSGVSTRKRDDSSLSIHNNGNKETRNREETNVKIEIRKEEGNRKTCFVHFSKIVNEVFRATNLKVSRKYLAIPQSCHDFPSTSPLHRKYDRAYRECIDKRDAKEVNK